MGNAGRVAALTCALLMGLACGDDDGPATEPVTETEPEPEPEPPPTLTCTLEGEPVQLAARSGPPAITAVGDAFVVASFGRAENDGEDFWMARVAPGAEPEELAKVSITESQPERHPNAPAALATVDAETVGVAVVGRSGEVSAGRLDLSAEPPALTLAPVENGARRTDPPVVVPAGDRLAVAWTQASTYQDIRMFYFCGFGRRSLPEAPEPPAPTHGHQVRLALVDADGTVHTRRDATPRVQGAQAVAPVAVDGVDPPAVLFLDPRSGVGTAHRVGVRAEGFIEPETVRPLSNLRDQTDVAAAAGPGGPWLAYSALGNGATSAIGLVSLADSAAPVPLVPGTGYDPLYVAGTAIDGAAVFAAEAPRDTGIAKEIRIRAVNAAGPGEPLVLADPPEPPPAEAEPTPTTPRALMGQPDVRGSLSREVIRRVVHRHLGEVRACHGGGVARRPDLEGRVTLRFVISPTGAVQTSAVANSTIADPGVESCVAAASRRWTFPEPEGGGVVIATVPFVLQPDGGEPLPDGPTLWPAGTYAPAIAARASDDLLGVAYSTGQGVYVSWVRCGE